MSLLSWVPFYPAGWHNEEEPNLTTPIDKDALGHYDDWNTQVADIINSQVPHLDAETALLVQLGVKSSTLACDWNGTTGTDDGPALQALFDTGRSDIYINGPCYINTAVFPDDQAGSTTVNWQQRIHATTPTAQIILGPTLPTCDAFLLDQTVKWAFFPNIKRGALSGSVVQALGAGLGSPFNSVRAPSAGSQQNPGLAFHGFKFDGLGANVGVAFSQGKSVEFAHIHSDNVKHLLSGKLYTDSLGVFRDVFFRWTTTPPGTVALTSCTITSGSATILSAGILAVHEGMPVTPSAQIPPGCYVKKVVPGVSFQLHKTYANASGGGSVTATASATATVTVGNAYAWMYVQQTYGDNIVFDNIKGGGAVGFGHMRECHGATVNVAIGGGWVFSHCTGIVINGFHRQLSQPQVWPAMTLERSKVTVNECVNIRGDNANGAYSFFINDDATGTQRPTDSTDLRIVHPEIRFFAGDTQLATDSTAAPDLYVYNLNQNGKVVVEQNAAGVNSLGGTIDFPGSFIVDSAQSNILSAIKTATYSGPLGIFGADFKLAYTAGAWAVSPPHGPRRIDPQAAPTLAVTGYGFLGTLTAATQYAYAAAMLDDDGQTSSPTTEQTFTTAGAYSSTYTGSDVDISTFDGTTAITVASVSGATSGNLAVVVTGPDGGSTSALLSYTGVSGSTLTGISTVAGQGVLNTGNVVASPATNQLAVTYTAPGSSMVVWRKTGTGVLASPDFYCIIPMRGTKTYMFDTGTHLNGRLWTAVTGGSPVSSGFTGTSLLTRYPTQNRSVLSPVQVLAAGTTYSNDSGSNHALWTPTLVDPKYLTVGSWFDFDMFGKFSRLASDAGAYTFRLRTAGGTTLLSVQVAPGNTAVSNQTGLVWQARLRLRVDATGASGGTTAIVSGFGPNAAASGTSNYNFEQVVTGLDLSGGFAPVLTFTMATANTANAVFLDAGRMIQEN